MRRGQIIDLEIDGIASDGDGIGTALSGDVHVPFTIPGERVSVRITRPPNERVLYGDGEGVRLLAASGDRTPPSCAVFGAAGCVRCSWQHMAYDAQLALKADILLTELDRAGIPAPELLPALASPDQWGYHWHMTFNVADPTTLGLPGRAGGTIAFHDCDLLHPDLAALIGQLDLDLSGITKVRLGRGSDGAQAVTLFLREEDAPELEADFPASVNALLPDNTPMNLIGDAHLNYTVSTGANTFTFRATVGSYFRANVPQIGPLVGAVMHALDIGAQDRVLDLYAGVGVFAAFAAVRASLVTVIESYPPAVTDADTNLAMFEHVTVIEGGVGDVLDALIDEDESYTAAIIDTPAGRFDAALPAQLADLGVRRVALVIDHPGGFGAAARAFGKAGYTLRTAQIIDLSPQTHFVDAVGLFERE